MESITNEQQATLRDYLRIIFRQRHTIFATVFCVMLVVFLGLQFKTPEYESRVRMISIAKKYFENTYFKDSSDYRSTELTMSQSEMVKSNPVLERAVRRLRLNEQPLDYEKSFASPLKAIFIDLKTKGLEKKLARYPAAERDQIIFRMRLQELKKKVKVEQIKDTNLFTITAKDFDPVNAAKIANAVSRSYCIFDLEQQLSELQQRYGEKHLIIMQLKDNINGMLEDLSGDSVSNEEAIGPASVKIVEQALVPFEPAGVPNSLILVLALFLSTCLGTVLAFGLESMDSTIKTPEQIREYLGFSLLGYLPKIETLPVKVLRLLRF
ncbi:MAG: lipopolysaccharide biosynthesis protein, partial [Candidatus Omnitrophica bacterium]|nr:lipopolysaccharide biosynthesis protein [Candidatus Omnitrophota bacterium]